MVKKIKLRDLTVTQYENWVEENCGDSRCCDDCLFDKAQCCIGSLNCWIKNKDLYSDRFLDQEVLIEVVLTNDEKIILRNIDKDFDYIVREKDDRLYLCCGKPIKENDEWCITHGCCALISFPFDHLFQFIKWEDNEPYSIEELIK